MVESRTIRIEISDPRVKQEPILSVDVTVYPWHVPYGDEPWDGWLDHVGRQWLDRTGGNPAGSYRAVALDVAKGLTELVAVGIDYP